VPTREPFPDLLAADGLISTLAIDYRRDGIRLARLPADVRGAEDACLTRSTRPAAQPPAGPRGSLSGELS
jgi:hypothetical protein